MSAAGGAGPGVTDAEVKAAARELDPHIFRDLAFPMTASGLTLEQMRDNACCRARRILEAARVAAPGPDRGEAELRADLEALEMIVGGELTEREWKRETENDRLTRALAAAEARADQAERERDEARGENDKLRAVLANADIPCVYCGLSRAEMAKCAHGFPGCGRADDMMADPDATFGPEDDTQLGGPAREGGVDVLSENSGSVATRVFPFPDSGLAGVSQADIAASSQSESFQPERPLSESPFSAHPAAAGRAAVRRARDGGPLCAYGDGQGHNCRHRVSCGGSGRCLGPEWEASRHNSTHEEQP